MTPLYTAHATATGGRAGRASTPDGQLELTLAMPKAMGGSGEGTNPEQLFAAGYAACFQSAMLFIAGQDKLDVGETTVAAEVSIGESDAGPGFALAVRHTVTLPGLDQAAAEALVAKAHAVCPYSNATRGNIPVEFTVQGGAA